MNECLTTPKHKTKSLLDVKQMVFALRYDLRAMQMLWSMTA